MSTGGAVWSSCSTRPPIIWTAGGVKVFNTGEEEQVVSVAWIAEKGEDADENELEAEDPN